MYLTTGVSRDLTDEGQIYKLRPRSYLFYDMLLPWFTRLQINIRKKQKE
jgi:hypothetical protein